MTYRYPDFDGTQACLGIDPTTARAFAEAPAADLQPARAVCHACDFRRDCLEYAIHTDVSGIWAGTSTAERAELRARRRLDEPPSISDELDAWVAAIRTHAPTKPAKSLTTASPPLRTPAAQQRRQEAAA